MSSILYIKYLPRTKIFLLLLLVYVELLISAPKTMAFLPRPFEYKKLPFESKSMPYLLYLYLSMSLLLVTLTAPNKQFCRVGSKSLEFDSKS